MYINDDDLRRGAAPPAGPPGDLLAEYHSMMREFLRVQESVMLAWLGQPEAAQAAAARPVAMPAPAMPAPRLAAPVAAPVAPVAQAPAPVAPAPQAAAAPVDLMAAFLAIVADKTGYPEDALDPDQGMEADLGIDSIKRMEILGAVQKVLPEEAGQAMRARMAEITELSTIRQIVTFLDTALKEAPAAPAAPAAAGAAGPFEATGTETKGGLEAPLSRYIQTPFAEDAGHVVPDLPEGFRVLVTETGDGLHQPVIRLLVRAGTAPVLLPRAVIDAGADNPGGLADWIAARDADARPQGLIWLESRAAMPALATLDLSGWRALQAGQTRAFFRALQILGPGLAEGGRILAVTETGGLFGRDTGADRPGALSAGAGVIGILKALSLEWRACSSKVVDLDPAEGMEARAAHLVAEIGFLQGRREAGYPGGRRTILRTEPAAITPPAEAALHPGPDWVILATGGARGITAECLRTLAPFGPRLVLVGRSPLPPPEEAATQGLPPEALRRHFLEVARAAGDKPRPAAIEARIARLMADRDILANVADLAALGATVDYRIADVADEAALPALLDDLYARHGRIDMVLHGAGLIEDKLLSDKPLESYDRVFAAKADSAFLLARHLRPESLKALCFFTSVAGRYGNRGQTDYAAANETLNRLAWDLSRKWPGTRVKAINWGPWGKTSTGAGMVTEPVRAQFLARGIGMVEAGPGREMFAAEMLRAHRDEVESVGWEADGETMEESATALPTAPGVVPLGPGYPLLQKARRGADGALRWTFALADAPYVDHHRFDGHPVMPVAAVLQIMAETARACGESRPVVAIEEMKMMKGLTLADGPFDLHLSLQPAGDDGRRRVEIRAAEDMKRLRYSALLSFGTPGPGGESPRPADPAARWGGPDMATIYREWLSHGPRFQTLDVVKELAPGHVVTLAHATRPETFVPVPPGTEWDFDPGLIDGVLQTAWIWSRAVQGASTLPLGVRAVRRFAGDASLGPLRVETTILTPPESSAIMTTVRIFDRTGALVLRLEDFAGQSSPRLNRLGGGWQGGVPAKAETLKEAAE